MQVLKLFKDSIINFNATIRAVNLKAGKRLGYMTILAMILALPFFMESIKIMAVFSENGQAIIQRIPEFTIVDGKLKTDVNDPFIYQTDFLTYAYDPQNEIDFADVVDLNRLGLAVETNVDNHTLNVMGQVTAISHQDLNADFNQESLKQLITTATQSTWWTYPVMFMFLTLLEIGYVALLALFIALFTNFIVANKGLPIFFKQRFNLALPAMTMPVIGITLLKLFGIMVPYQFELIVILSLIQLYFIIKHTRIITVKPGQSDEKK